MCIFTSIEVFPTQETLPVNLMSQSGYMTFLHKSTRQTLDNAGDNSLIAHIRKSFLGRVFLCHVSSNTHEEKSEKIGLQRTTLQFLFYLFLLKPKEETGMHLSDGWPTHTGVQQNVTGVRPSSTRTNTV